MSDLKIFAKTIEQSALDQIYQLSKMNIFNNVPIRIMPDCHSGKGCVIGFTAKMNEYIIPSLIGVDIGCGMLTVNLGKVDIYLEKLDSVIRQYIPSGRNIREEATYSFNSIKDLYCYDNLKDKERFEISIGTLGGGNHFIEVDVDEDGNKYLIIHSGSRNLGKQVAEYYQNVAIDIIHGKYDIAKEQERIIREYKASGREKEIANEIKELKSSFQSNPLKIPKELCYLTGEWREKYLHDMKICQEYAKANRNIIAGIIVKEMGLENSWNWRNVFTTVHNYIDHDTNIVRKGAISAKKDELLLIPINMRDGCIIGKGKGNDDWNQSAPHGAGRIMSRSKAKELLSMEEYRDVMSGIYTTSISESTIDESPMAYKPMDEIVENIKDTVEIIKIIKPIYNFKASE